MKSSFFKPTFTALLLSILTLGSTLSYAQSDYLKSMVNLFSDMMPYSMGMAGELTDISVNDNELIFTATVDETLVNIDALQQNKALLQENMKLIVTILNSNIIMKSILEELVESNMGLRMTYIGKDSKKKLSCLLNSKEIESALADTLDNTNAKKQLELQVSITRAQLPIDYGNGMVNTKIELTDKYIIYHIVCDEDIYDIDLLNASTYMIKQNIIQTLSSGDLTLTQLVKLCKESNYGIGYYYVGKDSGKIAKVFISDKELK